MKRVTQSYILSGYVKKYEHARFDESGCSKIILYPFIHDIIYFLICPLWKILRRVRATY